MTNKAFVFSLPAVLAVTFVSGPVRAQASSPSAEPSSAPPGSVPIEPERREPERLRTAPRPPPPRPPAGRIDFVPNDPSVSLLTQTGVVPTGYGIYEYYGWGYRRHRFLYGGYAPTFTQVCRGRCTVSMEPGTYELALERNGRVARAAPTYVPGNAELHGDYLDRSGMRTAGVVIGVTGTIAGIVMIVASFESHLDCDPSGVCFEHDTVDGPLFAGGLGALVGSVIVGSILVSMHDRAEITVTPLKLSSTPRFTGVALDRGVTEGAALSIRF